MGQEATSTSCPASSEAAITCDPQREVQQLHRENRDIIAAARHHGYEAVDTLSITMGRHQEFLQGQCACHFHQVAANHRARHAGLLLTPSLSLLLRPQVLKVGSADTSTTAGGRAAELEDQGAWPKSSTYHVRGPVNRVYSEILLSRLCPSG